MKGSELSKRKIIFGILAVLLLLGSIFAIASKSREQRSVKVSICLPCYNVAPYLPRALDSAIHQSLEDIEIICVDDGSTDETLSILEDYAKRDSRIKVYKNSKNRGTLYTRLRSFKAAKGEYVLCLDPDDELFIDIAKRSYEAAIENDADIVHFGSEIYINGQYDGMDEPWFRYYIGILQDEAIMEAMADKELFAWSLCNKLIRRASLQPSIDYLDAFAEVTHLCNAEDLLICWPLLNTAHTYYGIEGKGFRYWKRVSEPTPQKQLRNMTDIGNVLEKIIAYEDTPEGKARAARIRFWMDHEGRWIAAMMYSTPTDAAILLKAYTKGLPPEVKNEIYHRIGSINADWLLQTLSYQK